MKLSIFPIIVKKNDLHVLMFTDGKGNLFQLIPNEYKNNQPLFIAGDLINIEESIQKIQNVDIIPPIADKNIDSLWEEKTLLYSNSGWYGFRYFIGVNIYK